jgi:hypothetical protein
MERRGAEEDAALVAEDATWCKASVCKRLRTTNMGLQMISETMPAEVVAVTVDSNHTVAADVHISKETSFFAVHAS